MENLSNIEIVKGKCRECKLYANGASGCSRHFYTLTGESCVWKKATNGIGYILNKKKEWVQCTQANTKSGDTVRNPLKMKGEEAHGSRKVVTVYPDGDCVLGYLGTADKFVAQLERYEIEV